jgi:hypothetical protein
MNVSEPNIQPSGKYAAPKALLSLFAMVILICLSLPGILGITTYLASSRFTGVEPDWLTQVLTLVPRITSLPQNIFVSAAEAVPLILCRATLTPDQSRLSVIGVFSAVWLLATLIVTIPTVLLFSDSDPLAIQNLTGGKIVVSAISHASQDACRVCFLYLGAILGLRAWGT